MTVFSFNYLIYITYSDLTIKNTCSKEKTILYNLIIWTHGFILLISAYTW